MMRWWEEGKRVTRKVKVKVRILKFKKFFSSQCGGITDLSDRSDPFSQHSEIKVVHLVGVTDDSGKNWGIYLSSKWVEKQKMKKKPIYTHMIMCAVATTFPAGWLVLFIT